MPVASPLKIRKSIIRQNASICRALILASLVSITPDLHAQISKANQILISRGLQLQGLVQWDDFFHLDTYSNANYNTIDWGWTSSPSQMGPPPGVPWSRWVSADTNMPPQNGEDAYLSNLVSLQLADEWFIDDGPTRTNLINWFNSVRSNWPNTILFHNNYGGQASDAALADLIARGRPDMLSFDMYPFVSVWDGSVSNHIGAPIGGPFTGWYGELRRYRQWGINAQIPFSTYVQTFHSVEDYDTRVYRYPSPSELRLNTFAALAFNAKSLIGFTYNSGATVLFDILPNGYSGDTYPNTLYTEQADINRRAKNLGKALVCLQPIYDLHNPNDANPPPGPASGETIFPDGITTSIMFLQGRTVSGGATNATPLPNSFVSDPEEQTNPANPGALIYSWWEFAKNDPWFIGWGVTNQGGVENNGLPGEVIIAWFKPLDESFDGPSFTNEVYMMVVNALTATNGTAADCLQEIKLNFSSSVPSAVVMLDSETGLLQTNTMPVLVGTSGRRQLILDLNGGDAALFKFADNAPFVGFVLPSRPQLTFQIQSGMPTITIQGTIGAHYELQSSPTLENPTWTALTNFLLPGSPYQFSDGAPPGAGARFYRAIGIP